MRPEEERAIARHFQLHRLPRRRRWGMSDVQIMLVSIPFVFLFGLFVGFIRGREQGYQCGLKDASESAIVRNRVTGKGGPLGLD